jgi:hypothetical protein
MPETYQGWSRAGAGNTSAFQVSGRPWLSGSNITGSGTNNGEVMFTFPFITKSITVVNKNINPIVVSCDTIGNYDVKCYHHYITLSGLDDSCGMDSRIQNLYISMVDSSKNGSVEISAELTSIEFSKAYVLSGSGINCIPV